MVLTRDEVDDIIIFVFDFQEKKKTCKNFLVRLATKIIESFHLQLTIKSNQITIRISYQHYILYCINKKKKNESIVCVSHIFFATLKMLPHCPYKMYKMLICF